MKGNKQLPLFLVVLIIFGSVILIGLTPFLPGGETAAQDLTVFQRLDQAKNLNVLSGNVPTFYSKGYEDQARGLQRVLRKATNFFSDSLGVNAQLHLALLDSTDWKVYSKYYPYGALWVSDDIPVAFVPATRDVPLAHDYLTLKPKNEELNWISEGEKSFEDAAARMIDLIAFHEVGHTYHSALDIGHPSRWFNEFMATYLAYAFLRSDQPQLAEIWNGMLQLKAKSTRPSHTTLEDFEDMYFGVGIENYNWYQAQFQTMAHDVFDDLGLRFIKLVSQKFPEEEGTVKQTEILARLERIFPGFQEWATVFRANR